MNKQISTQQSTTTIGNKNRLLIVAFIIISILFGFLILGAAKNYQATQLEKQLTLTINALNLTPIDLGPTPDPAKVALGKALFFDKELSGNRDVACATCHHPLHGSHDELALSIGVGGTGLGPQRALGEARVLVPRNATDIFNRGSAEWRTMFWDGRVQQLANDTIDTPADEELPPDLDNIVAVQAMFPVTSIDEMRGKKGELDVNGQFNELGAMNEDDFSEIWAAIMLRILAIPEYRASFATAYPDVPATELGFEHAANAIAAFEIAAFSFDDTPWDAYLRGETAVLSTEAKKGALLFYGKANCGSCHAGNLTTDQQYHNLLVPQLGPGKGGAPGYDLGRALVTDEQSDAFAFRTPPLRNVAISGPWMHNGAYNSLEAVLRHHIDPLTALQTFNTDHLTPELAATFKDDLSTFLIMTETFDAQTDVVPELTDAEIADLSAFLHALTSETAVDLSHLIPDTVPSGLPVDRQPGTKYATP